VPLAVRRLPKTSIGGAREHIFFGPTYLDLEDTPAARTLHLRAAHQQDALAAGIERTAHVVNQFLVNDAERVGLVQPADFGLADLARPVYSLVCVH
jgi:hypothetical protein